MTDRVWETRHVWRTMSDCPFCQAKASEFHISLAPLYSLENVLTGFVAECDECGAHGPDGRTEHSAIARWNAREAA